MASGLSNHTTETVALVDREHETTPPPFERSARLVCVLGEEVGRTFVLEAEAVIGRGDAHISIDESEVSRRHAIIRRDRDEYVLTDLGSRNGTSVNGVRIREHTLRPGDRIQLGGGAVFVFTVHDELESRALRFQKLEGLAAVTGGIVHDFKNTLGVIIANVALLEDELASLPSGSEARAMLEDIAAAARAGLGAAKRLLYFSDRRGGDGWEDIDVASILDQLMGPLRRPLAAEHIEVEVRAEPALCVRGSRDELHHALLNLVLNARDAMASGGRLQVVARGRSFARSEALALHLSFAGEYAEIVVADTGAGMEASTQARIFEPFFTTKPPGEGTGLGLSTVYGIIRRHGGNVLVDSAPGAGTRMRVLLPHRVAPG